MAIWAATLKTATWPSGGAVCNFSIATTDRFTDKAGQKQERTEWHNIVMYGKLAEIAAQYLKKGSAVYVEGRLQTRKWQDKNTGADRYSTEIIADQMQMLSGRGQGAKPIQTTITRNTARPLKPPRQHARPRRRLQQARQQV